MWIYCKEHTINRPRDISIFLSVAALLLGGCEPPKSGESTGEVVATTRPNILLVIADDLGFTDFGSYGGEMGVGKWMRQGAYKAVSVVEPYGTGRWKLFNVEADTGETNDLASEMPDKLEELKAAWAEYAADVGVVLSE